jgi:hypothetical protein
MSKQQSSMSVSESFGIWEFLQNMRWHRLDVGLERISGRMKRAMLHRALPMVRVEVPQETNRLGHAALMKLGSHRTNPPAGTLGRFPSSLRLTRSNEKHEFWGRIPKPALESHDDVSACHGSTIIGGGHGSSSQA